MSTTTSFSAILMYLSSITLLQHCQHFISWLIATLLMCLLCVTSQTLTWFLDVPSVCLSVCLRFCCENLVCVKKTQRNIKGIFGPVAVSTADEYVAACLRQPGVSFHPLRETLCPPRRAAARGASAVRQAVSSYLDSDLILASAHW